MSTKAKSSKVQIPDDPDPTPIASASAANSRSAAREEQKRVAKSYGRQKTIIAASQNQPVPEKKSILGG
jgi:hypothetical protein